MTMGDEDPSHLTYKTQGFLPPRHIHFHLDYQFPRVPQQPSLLHTGPRNNLLLIPNKLLSQNNHIWSPSPLPLRYSPLQQKQQQIWPPPNTTTTTTTNVITTLWALPNTTTTNKSDHHPNNNLITIHCLILKPWYDRLKEDLLFHTPGPLKPKTDPNVLLQFPLSKTTI
jgi:hypothetical protein